MAGLVGDEANYDDSKKVWSLVYNTCQKVSDGNRVAHSNF